MMIRDSGLLFWAILYVYTARVMAIVHQSALF